MRPSPDIPPSSVRRALLALPPAALWGCASPPPAPPPPRPAVPEARQRMRFEDGPEGARVVLPDAILFEPGGGAALATDAGPVLDLLKSAFDRARGRIIVEGHTDTAGAAADKLKRSLDRAVAVRDAIVMRRVAAGRLDVRGLGGQRPRRSPETGDAERRANRRVEIVFPGETVDSLGGRQLEELGRSLAR